VTVPIIAFFNDVGGVGRTSLVYHISWMLADLGQRVVAADLDPQCGLSVAFLPEDRLEELWPEGTRSQTLMAALYPVQQGRGDIGEPHLEMIDDNLALLPGDPGLITVDETLSDAWWKSLADSKHAFLAMTAFWRIMQKAAKAHDASIILVDLGPYLGAINRAALLSSDFIVFPLRPDLFSLQGLRNLGPRLQEWRQGWEERLQRTTHHDMLLPTGNMEPLGYIVLQHLRYLGRPLRSYDKWMSRIPQYYQKYVLDTRAAANVIRRENDCIAIVRHYHSLMAMAQEARKPMFHLKPADGALGSHAAAALDAYRDFKAIAEEILKRIQDRQTATTAG
jgi:cellulose biosynthesis protein BcsQ